MVGYGSLPAVQRLIELALDEDLGRGDVTTSAVLGDRLEPVAAVAVAVAREPLVVFGLEVFREVVRRVEPAASVRAIAADGDRVTAGARLLELRGPAAGILRAERTALNFLQRLSGVATMARRYADAVAGTRARVVDTRKTTPGFRLLEKAAVAAGGCGNHRFDLASGVLIKDNHIAACGSLADAVARAKAGAPHTLRIEVEVDTLDQLGEALAAGADAVLLDNMSLAQIEAAVERSAGSGVLLEISGGVTLERLPALAATGVDFISVGALTHSAPSVDIGLDLLGAGEPEADA